MIQRVAMIGTREPDDYHYGMFQSISSSLVTIGIQVHTGNAEGIDNAVVKGALSSNPKNLHIYLPWKGYNKKAYAGYEGRINLITDLTMSSIESVFQYHPKAKALTTGALKLHARNYGIVMEPKVDMVIAYPNASNGGGTGQGMRLAKENGIPLYNLRKKDDYAKLKEMLKEIGLL